MLYEIFYKILWLTELKCEKKNPSLKDLYFAYPVPIYMHDISEGILSPIYSQRISGKVDIF